MRRLLPACAVALALPATASRAVALDPSCDPAKRGAHIDDHKDPANMGRSVRITGSGLTPGQPVYLHTLAGRVRSVRTVRLTRHAGACGDFVANPHPFAFRARTRSIYWRYQFDNRRRFSRFTKPRATEDYLRRVAIPAIGYREKMIGPSNGRFLP